jgi:hypothetical protein
MARRVDLNQPEIIAALQKICATVLLLQRIGHGCPNVPVGWRGKNYLLEIKRP